jgi:hypothetical protein
VILQRRGLYCGDVLGRTANGAVALLALCDRGSWSEDQAPASSRALWSPDAVTWTAQALEGEAYEEPGISPDGTAAVWPQHQRYLTRTSAEGFVARDIAMPGQEYTVTGAIGDDGRVSLLYGAATGRAKPCVVRVVSRTGDGPATREEVAAPDACGDVDLVNVDALTVRLGTSSSPESISTLTRVDTTSPWAVTGIAPQDAPSLVRHHGRGSMPTLFLHSPGLPMVAMGSADGSGLDTQVYDAASQRWEPVREIYPGRTCEWGDEFVTEPLGVLAPRVRCGRREHVLVSTDARTWQTARMWGHPLGVSADRQWVSVTNARRTIVFSRDLGAVRLPVGATRRCDVVLPSGPDEAVRLTTPRRDGWPRVLQESTGSRWTTTGTRVPRARVGDDVCRRVRSEIYETPPSYALNGNERVTAYTVRSRGDGWRVTRSRW